MGKNITPIGMIDPHMIAHSMIAHHIAGWGIVPPDTGGFPMPNISGPKALMPKISGPKISGPKPLMPKVASPKARPDLIRMPFCRIQPVYCIVHVPNSSHPVRRSALSLFPIRLAPFWPLILTMRPDNVRRQRILGRPYPFGNIFTQDTGHIDRPNILILILGQILGQNPGPNPWPTILPTVFRGTILTKTPWRRNAWHQIHPITLLPHHLFMTLPGITGAWHRRGKRPARNLTKSARHQKIKRGIPDRWQEIFPLGPESNHPHSDRATVSSLPTTPHRPDPSFSPCRAGRRQAARQ